MQIFAPGPNLDDSGDVMSLSFERGTVREQRIDMGEFRLDLYRAMQQIDRYLRAERSKMPNDLLRDERQNVGRLISMIISLPRSVRHEHHALHDEPEDINNPTPLSEIPGTWAVPIQEISNFASVQFPDIQQSMTDGNYDTPLDSTRLQELRAVISDSVGGKV